MFDIIILSYAQTAHAAAITQKCVDSFLADGGDKINKIIVVESEKSIKPNVYGKVHTIVPDCEFNYNKFLNFGLDECESDLIFFSNNDIVVHEGCLDTVDSAFKADDKLMSLCPIDRNWHRHSQMYFPTENKIYYGYETALHMFGCIYCVRRSAFNTIGYFDERFFFFYQDNDLAECLKRTGLKHGIHTGAIVTHKEEQPKIKEGSRFSYTPENMYLQGEIYKNKWYKEPYINSFVPFKEYTK